MQKLSETENQTYEFIKKTGELQTTNLPRNMWGALPSLKNKGLIEIFKKYTIYYRKSKKKFVNVK